MPDMALTDMQEISTRDEDDPSVKTKNLNGYVDQDFPAQWDRPGRVSIKHVDPSPMTILSVYPKGTSGS